MAFNDAATAVDEALLPATPGFVAESYRTLAERAKTMQFGLIEEDVVILDTETTGLSVQEHEIGRASCRERVYSSG